MDTNPCSIPSNGRLPAPMLLSGEGEISVTIRPGKEQRESRGLGTTIVVGDDEDSLQSRHD